MPTDRRETRRRVLYRAEVAGEDAPYEVEYESVADALHFACRDLRAERRRPLQILEDGRLVLDEERIRQHCAEERSDVAELLEHAAERDPAREP